MMNSRSTGFLFLVAALLGLSAYQFAQACSQNCLNITQSCATDGNGNCINQRCFQYTASGSDFTMSCWTCGAGAPGNGWCILGDANLKCGGPGPNINFKYYQSCTRSCNNANTYVEAGSMTDVMSKTGTEPRYLCANK